MKPFALPTHPTDKPSNFRIIFRTNKRGPNLTFLTSLGGVNKARRTNPYGKTRSDTNRAKANKAAAQIANCQAEVQLMGNYVCTDLSPATKKAFEKHLSACPDCVAFLNTYKKTIEATRRLFKNQSTSGQHTRPR